MSCRLYNGNEGVQPLIWPDINEGGSGYPAPSASAGSSSADVQELRNKLSELTRQSESQVRQAKAAGVAEGRQAAAAEIEPALQRLSQTVADLAGLKNKLRREAQEDVLKLSIAIARRILHRELNVDSDALAGLVAAALDRVQKRDLHKVRVHPGFHQALTRHLSSLGLINCEVAADPSLMPGDVIFETERGSLDASIDRQLGEVERGLTDKLR